MAHSEHCAPYAHFIGTSGAHAELRHPPHNTDMDAYIMPTAKLTDTYLRSLPQIESGQRDLWDATFPSFGVRIGKHTKTFILNIDGSRRTIGRFGILTLKEARDEARRQLAERTLGRIRPKAMPFQKALDEFLEEKRATRRPKTYANLKDRLERHFPFKGALGDVTHLDVQRRLSKCSTTTERDHVLAVATNFFGWCHNKRYIDDNPTRGLSPHGSQSRSRVLSDDELRAVWTAAEQMGGHYGTIIKLLIATGQRRGEIAALRAEYFNGAFANSNSTSGRQHNGGSTLDTLTLTCTLPATITKNKRQHTFPIGPLATSLISAACNSGAPFIFSARGKPTQPFNGWSKSKAALDKISGVKNWTLHDLRRSYRTIHAQIKTPPHIAEMLVNHVSARSQMSLVYDHYKYLPEMREAVNNYEAHLKVVLNIQ